ncbi:MAG: VWA domain-containing protein [Terracidiphilus sp.]
MNRKVLCLALAAIFASAAQSQQPSTPAPSAPASATTAPAQAPAAQQAPASAAQPAQQGTTADAAQQPFKIIVNEVPLIFTVTDGRGHYIPNLQQSDFALLDNQRAPEKVNRFRQQINLPLRVGLLIDTSTSIHSRFQFEQQSATEFLLEVLKARGDRAFVMGFDVTPDVTQDWTNNLDALETGVNKLKSGGGTALFDAVYTACRDKLLTSRGPEPVRKALIVISDGEDNQSRVYLNEAIKECQRADTIIYSISTNWTPSRGPGDKVMQELAEETGGEPFFPPNVEDMATSFSDIETELRSQYELDYTPADFKTDGSFRTIYLYCYNRGYHVHARKGYFAPKE